MSYAYHTGIDYRAIAARHEEDDALASALADPANADLTDDEFEDLARTTLGYVPESWHRTE